MRMNPPATRAQRHYWLDHAQLPKLIGVRRPRSDGWNTSIKYMVSWYERPQGSPMEYEHAQKRILEVFSQWKAPANFKIHSVRRERGRVGRPHAGGLRRSDRRAQGCSTFPAFEFQARPVIPVDDAIRCELEAIARREGLKRNG